MKQLSNVWLRPIFRTAALFPILLWLTGCGSEVRTYPIPKQKDFRLGYAGDKPVIRYEVPDGWNPESSSSMRVVNLSTPGKAEVIATPLPSRMGDVSMLVNMWREQVGLDPIEPDESESIAKPATIGGSQGKLYDMSGSKPLPNEAESPRLLVAMVEKGTVWWFFKLSGPAQSVSNEVDGFNAFLGNLEFLPGASEINFESLMRAAMTSAPPPGSQAPQAPSIKPEWTVPDGWSEKSASSMRIGSFQVSGAEGQADVSVTSFPGDVGGLLANVNRWRGQVGLEPVTTGNLEKESTPFEVSGSAATLVELMGEAQATLGVIHPVAERTWFYKMTGDRSVVIAQKKVFLEFLQSIIFPSD